MSDRIDIILFAVILIGVNIFVWLQIKMNRYISSWIQSVSNRLVSVEEVIVEKIIRNKIEEIIRNKEQSDEQN